MPTTPAALLDVDGTLVDTTYLHALAWWRALNTEGFDVPVTRLHRLIGMGSDLLLDELGVTSHEVLKRYWRHEYEKLVPEIRPLAGATALVGSLVRAGARVALATSGDPELVGPTIEPLDLGEITIANSGEVEAAKPHPDVFALALERVGGGDSVVCIGDTVWDVEAANRLGATCIALTSGGIAACELREAGAAAVFESPADLLQRWDGSPLRELVGPPPSRN